LIFFLKKSVKLHLKNSSYLTTQLRKINIPQRWLWAVLLSILLHTLLLGGWHFEMPNFESPSHLIEAKLLPPPVKKIVKKPLAPKKAKQPVKHKQSSNEVSREPDDTQVSEQAEAPKVVEPLWREEDRPAYEEMARLSAPSFVDMDFDVKRVNGFGRGRAHYRYQAEPDGRYILRSEIEAVGLVSIAFAGKRIETSVGKITDQGLQPEAYRLDITTKPEKLQAANFDWVNHKLTLKTSKSEIVEELLEGTQDFLSFMYQFMFVPPLERMEWPLTNGKMVRVYNYQFISEEVIATKFGQINTYHIAKSSGDAEEKTDVWLAEDYRFIPIKILKITKDGSGFEFIATRIDTDIAK
jgi:hypothetical protein